jgi:hypothetical protein
MRFELTSDYKDQEEKIIRLYSTLDEFSIVSKRTLRLDENMSLKVNRIDVLDRSVSCFRVNIVLCPSL